VTLSPDAVAADFLKEHRLGVLATGRRDGSPQQALVAYDYDGSDIVISTRRDSAKAMNLRRQPSVSLNVSDGPKSVTVYGDARLIEAEDEVLAYSKTRLRSRREQTPLDDDALRQRIRTNGTVVIAITPARFLASRLG
jgi:PPOX class probable F420-dependent enzyme